MVGVAGLVLAPLAASRDDAMILVAAGPAPARILLAVAGCATARARRPRTCARYAELLEVLVVLAMVPVICAVLGLYGVRPRAGRLRWRPSGISCSPTSSSSSGWSRPWSPGSPTPSSRRSADRPSPPSAASRWPSCALAGVGVYGLIVPGGNKAWQTGDVIVVEKETGTRFVYVDGRLHPVTNYVSALLALGKKAGPRACRASRWPTYRGGRGSVSPDAPDALPDRGRLLTGGWTLCSEPAMDVAGAETSESVLMVGRPPAGRAARWTTRPCWSR